MGTTEVKISNEIKLLDILSRSYQKALTDLNRIDKYLFGDDIAYACEDIYSRMSNIIKETSAMEGIGEENIFLQKYIKARDIILHNTLDEAVNVCTEYLKEIENTKCSIGDKSKRALIFEYSFLKLNLI